ncbi:AIPR family protein [Sporosarcina sp. FSL K6-2383]|uniref:AIPR family protein n=1 Tax=Sporosarcina sp. FSL K6-2383 TaxID=2921556 RepID=UPI00315AAC23
MATIHDYKISRVASERIFDLIFKDLLDTSTISEADKARLGFYHIIVENTLGFKAHIYNYDDVELNDGVMTKIIDTNYLEKLYNPGYKIDDYGVDVVSIEELSSSEVNIDLFNFKYRESFKQNHISDKDISRSSKFLTMLLGDDDSLDESENILVHKIINLLKSYTKSDSKYNCNITLHMVSNEAFGLHENSYGYIDQLKKSYGVEINSITLDNIAKFYTEKKQTKSASFIVAQEDLISFTLDRQTSNQSFIVKLPLNELIRITCDHLRLPLNKNPNLDEWKSVLSVELDRSLLYDNVRGYLGDTDYNKNILKTLKTAPENFFLFNNGITLISDKIESNKLFNKFEIALQDYQIVNGGQTISTIFAFLKQLSKDNDFTDEEIHEVLSPLFNSQILIRLFKVPQGSNLKNLIAEYTNSQNAISALNLKSISTIQIKIEGHFKLNNIVYARKAGEIGSDIKNPLFRIAMDELAQVIYSAKGNPEKVSSQKKKLFTDYYDDIFPEETFDLDYAYKLAMSFENIKQKYIQLPQYKRTDQKVFYIIYLISQYDLDVINAINKLEEAIQTYNVSIPDNRKLIQVNFRKHLDSLVSSPVV